MRFYFRLLTLIVATVALSSASAVAETALKEKLLKLATTRFGPDNSLAEQQLFELAVEGGDIDCTTFPDEFRVIRTDRLSWLLTDREASPPVSYRGISIVGAKIHGPLDLSWAKISFPLGMRQCVLDDTLILICSHLSSLYLNKTMIKELHAEGMLVEGDVYLRDDFKCQREASPKNSQKS